jgi:subtilisin
MKSKKRWVVLPSRGMKADNATPDPAVRFLLACQPGQATPAPARFGLGPGLPQPPAGELPVEVIDSIHENGAKLIEATDAGVVALRSQVPGLRIVPVVYYRKALVRAHASSARRRAKVRAGPTLAVRVVSSVDGAPIRGATLDAYRDFDGDPVAARTDARGRARLSLGARSARLERLYVEAHPGYWGHFRRNSLLRHGDVIELEPIDLGFADCLRALCGIDGAAAPTAGAGVRVGVIDDGIDLAHRDLAVAGGLNTVEHEYDGDHGDAGGGHGTHVAGIIAARGTPPAGVRGVAPGAALHSYRVFGRGSEEATNFSIAKAIDAAVADGCDLVNLSLGYEDCDSVVEDALMDAREKGTVAIAAAGNSYRGPIDYPARHSLAVAVSAVGRRGTFPRGAAAAGDVGRPSGRDRRNFLAEFTNVGPEVDFTAPGVGVVSTYPGGYAAMSGTSMAAPALTGLAARLLGAAPALLGAARDANRASAIVQLMRAAATPLGLGEVREGHGLPS